MVNMNHNVTMMMFRHIRLYRYKGCWLSEQLNRSRSTSTATAPNVGYTTDYEKAKPFSDIPGPQGLPYIGTMLKYRKGPFNKYNIDRYQEAVMDLYTQYGKIVKETIAGTTILHLFDPDDIRTMFMSEGKMPHVAPLMETTQLYRQQKGLALGLGNTNGEEWYHLRSAVQQMMMRPAAVTVYLPSVVEVADDFIQRIGSIRGADCKVPDLRNEISKWNVESAAMTVFERRLRCLEDGPGTEVQNMIDANCTMFTVSAKMKFKLPLHKMFKTPLWKQLVAAEDCVLRTSQRYLDETITKIKSLVDSGRFKEGQYNFLSYLLGREQLSNNDIAIITLSLFGDGLSTTVPTLASNIYCLARYPEAQQQVYQEVTRVIPPGTQITADMISQMPILKAFVKEAFRFFPIGLDVARIPQQNLVIKGYQVPAGTHVEMNNFVMFKDSKYFDSPEEFRLDRWLRDGSAQNIHPFILTPFGHGPRMCAGRRFAEQEMYVVIAKLVQKFRLEWPYNRDMGQKYQILMVPDSPIDVIFHNRKTDVI